MEELKNIIISKSEYDLENGGKGKIAVFIYTGASNPKPVLDYAIHLYVETNGYHQFIDANLDNPWTRVIMSDINGMKQDKFNPSLDKMKPSK